MGESYALACAVAWSFAVILFRRSGETVSPLGLNLFRVAWSSVLFAVSMVVMGRPLLGQAPLADYLILAVSGLIAIALSDTLFHQCLNRVGAGVTAIVDSLYSPFVVIFAFFMLGERLGPLQILGMGLVIGGVLLATRVRLPEGLDRRGLIVGILYGMGAMLTLTFGIVLAKPVLERSDVLWATAVRQFFSLGALVVVALLRADRRELFAVLRPQRSWRFSLPGTVLGSYVALMLWIAGMKYTATGTAAILNQTSTLFILFLASLFLHERLTWRKALSAALTLAGIVLVILPR